MGGSEKRGDRGPEGRKPTVEEAALRYRAALEAGNADAVAEILRAAITDPELDRRLEEINREAEKDSHEEFEDRAKPRLYEGQELSQREGDD